MNYLVVPAIIADNQERMEFMLSTVMNHVRRVQLDVMDGKFVPSRSLNFDFELTKKTIIYEAHLMIENPEKWIKENGHKVDIIIVHVEMAKNLKKIIRSVKDERKNVAFALNPESGIDIIKPVIRYLDQVTVMTVHPGRYGSKFLPSTLRKVTTLRKFREDLDIEVDGGMNLEYAKRAKEHGANIICSGSFIFGNAKPIEAVTKLNNIFK